MLFLKGVSKRFGYGSMSSSSETPSRADDTDDAVKILDSRQNGIYSSLSPQHPSSTSVAYFNNAGKTPIPAKVEEAGRKALLAEAHPWKECSEEIHQKDACPSLAIDDASKVRHQFSTIIGAPCSRSATNIDRMEGHEVTNCIAICPSTGFALTLAAQNVKKTIGAQDQILIAQDEMSSAVYCWQQVCDETDASLVIVEHPTFDDDEGWTMKILKALDDNPRTKVVCLPQVHWSDGSLIDLKVIGERCKEMGCIFVVDATQSVGIYPCNVQEIQCHVLAASVHKWLLGPHGMSLMYVDPQFHSDWQPLDQHERSRRAFEDEAFDAQENTIGKRGYPSSFVHGAARLDAGGKKNPIILPMMVEALTLVNQLDLSAAQQQLGRIVDKVLEGGKKIGFSVQGGPRANHIIGLRPATDKLRTMLTPTKMVEVVHNLKGKGVYIAARSGAFRIAPYLNTTFEDVDKLISALRIECEQGKDE